MSNALAIAAVTETLRTMIYAAVRTDPVVAGGVVTAAPPDAARKGNVTNQVNLFLYQTGIDAAWRNQEPPGTRPGEPGPPLALVLSYLLTAYGENDNDVLAHRLLGLAMRTLHERPLLSPSAIAGAFPGSGLETQIERVRITPSTFPVDVISRLWTTFSTGYRISTTYDASVVLIDSERATIRALPVLARSREDLGPTDFGPFVYPLAEAEKELARAYALLGPQLDGIELPPGHAAAAPGDTVTVDGRNLEAVTDVQLSAPALKEPVVLPRQQPAAGSADTQLTFQIEANRQLPAGTVSIAAVTGAGAAAKVVSNSLPLVLAPKIQAIEPARAKLVGGVTQVTISCVPAVQAGQPVALVVDDRVIAGAPAAPGAGARERITFELDGFQAGTYTLRLRVEGADSVPFVESQEPPSLAMDPAQRLVLTE